MVYFISKCKIFVGNDGGLSHLASCVGIPTFVIFGPSSDIKNKPFNKNSHSIGLDLSCRPCQFSKDENGNEIFGSNKANCPLSMKCMKNLSTEFVFSHIKNYIKKDININYESYKNIWIT